MPSESTIKKKYITIEEYLRLEDYSQVKHEYLGGSVVEMPGTKYNHNVIGANTIVTFSNLLSSTQPSCKVLMDGMKIHIPAHSSILYPDMSVLCGEPIFYKGRKDVLTNPKVIVEVLSESTKGYDRGEKFEKYSSLDSIEEYILIEQDRPFVEVFFAIKKEEDLWKISRYYNFEDQVQVRSLGVSFPLSVVYKHIDFPGDE